jgi:hypothetical protein
MELIREHLLPPEIEFTLILIMGVCWILTYLILIYRGFKDKSCGMPFAALCGNITWEYIYSFVFPHAEPQVYVNYTWFSLNLIIVFQFILYSRSELPKPLSTHLFIPTFILSLFTAFSIHYTFAFQFSDFEGVFTAFGLNMMMSLLFVLMLLQRDHLRGQSMYIAVFKFIGTLGASIAGYSFYPSSMLLLFLYVSTFFLDLLYVCMLYYKMNNSAVVRTGRRLSIHR